MRCKTVRLIACLALAGSAAARGAETNNADSTIVVNVPGYANPWLAGAPDGTIAGAGYDVAPDQSPSQITGIAANAATVLTFSVVGGVTHDPAMRLVAADGNNAFIWSRQPGVENGIGDITAPCEALIGVFLDDTIPGDSAVPPALDFGSPEARDFATLSPGLCQPFFIGDGLTSDGQIQEFVAPPGATRLFLGTMDSWGWLNNKGSYTVKIKVAQPLVQAGQPFDGPKR